MQRAQKSYQWPGQGCGSGWALTGSRSNLRDKTGCGFLPCITTRILPNFDLIEFNFYFLFRHKSPNNWYINMVFSLRSINLNILKTGSESNQYTLTRIRNPRHKEHSKSPTTKKCILKKIVLKISFYKYYKVFFNGRLAWF